MYTTDDLVIEHTTPTHVQVRATINGVQQNPETYSCWCKTCEKYASEIKGVSPLLCAKCGTPLEKTR